MLHANHFTFSQNEKIVTRPAQKVANNLMYQANLARGILIDNLGQLLRANVRTKPFLHAPGDDGRRWGGGTHGFFPVVLVAEKSGPQPSILPLTGTEHWSNLGMHACNPSQASSPKNVVIQGQRYHPKRTTVELQDCPT
jgi:hypothetical protein